MKTIPKIMMLSSATLLVWCASSQAQSASLMRRSALAAPPGVVYTTPITLDEVSLIKLPPPPTYRLHDLIHIEVNEVIVNRINSRINKRRNLQHEYTLEDWIVILNGLRLRADQTIRTQTPGITLNALNTEQKQYQFNRDDILEYELQAEVVEIRPNGNLVLEAHGEVSVNNEVYQYSMSGIVSPVDIDPLLRSVDSTHVASRKFDLVQLGQARDALKRGWISAVLDWFLPL